MSEKMQICDEMQLQEAPSTSAASVGVDLKKLVPAASLLVPVPVAPVIQQSEVLDQGIRESGSNFSKILHRAVPGVERVPAGTEVSLAEAVQSEDPKTQVAGQVEQQSNAQV